MPTRVVEAEEHEARRARRLRQMEEESVGKAVTDVKAGKIDFKVDKYGIVHASIGKVSFDAKKLEENAAELLSTLMRLKPSSAKGTYVKSISMSATMGPGIYIEQKTATA